MPLKKFIPPKSRLASLGGTRVSTPPPSPGPVLVPFTPPTPTPPAGGGFSNAFSNAFDI
jgi:hypothetical protein